MPVLMLIELILILCAPIGDLYPMRYMVVFLIVNVLLMVSFYRMKEV